MSNQRFLSALVALCAEHDVEINGEFTVWPRGTESPVLTDIEHVGPDGILVTERRAIRHMPEPWSWEMCFAFSDGVRDAETDRKADPSRSSAEYESYYWLGWTRGKRGGMNNV